MPILYDTVIIAFAVWRVSYMVVNENGPYDIFVYPSIWLDIQYDPTTEQTILPDDPHKRMFAGLITCIYCLSVWVGIIFAILYFFFPIFTFWIALPLAFSAFAIAWEKILNG